MRVTVPSRLFATQTEPAPTATPVGTWPTGVVVVTARMTGSIRATALPSTSTTQTPEPSTATAPGALLTGIGVRRPVGSTRVTLFPTASAIHSAPSPIAIALAPLCGSMVFAM